MNSIITTLKLMASGVWKYLLPKLKRMLKAYAPLLLKTAAEVCLSLVKNEIPGMEKKEIAFNEIKGKLITAGFQVATSEIYGAIEDAVIYLEDSGQKPNTLTSGNI